MKLLMESWRKYMTTVDTFEKQYSLNSDEYDTVYLIKENKQVESTSMSLLVEQYNKDLINEDKFGDILFESIEYEYQQLINEGVLDALKKVAGKVGGVVKPALAAAQLQARKAFYKVIYGTASKIIKFVTSLSKKAMNYLGSYMTQVSKFKDNPPKPNVAQKLIARGVKIAKVVGSIFKKVGSFMIKVIQSISKFLGHPVVKNTILIGSVLIAGVALAAPGAIAGTSMAFLVPFATRRTAFAGAKELGAAAVGSGKYDLNKDKTEKEIERRKGEVNEETEIAYGMTAGMQEILNDLSQQELGIMINDVAEDIGSGKLDRSVELSTVQNVVTDPDGKEIVSFTDSAWAKYSDQNLKAQYAALDILKQAGRGEQHSLIFESAKDLEKWQAQTEAILKNAARMAKEHCASDPLAACAGAEAFINDIEIANTAVVNTEFIDEAKQTVEGAKVHYEEVISQKASVDQRFAVTRGGEEGLEKYYKKGKDLPAGYEEVPDREPEVRSRRRGIEN